MENLKIKVNSEAESKKVQDLFDKLNLDCVTWSTNMQLPFFICNWIEGKYSNYSLEDSGLNHLKESSIQRLQDMVVLKRNSVDDANYTCDREKKYYVTGNDVYMYIHQGVWSLCEKFPLEKAIEHWKLKPIKKEKTMKEWIYKDGSGEYVLTTDPEVANLASDAVEVPNGAEKFIVKPDASYFVRFRDGLWNQFYINSRFTETMKWLTGQLKNISMYDEYIVWQRLPNQTAIGEKVPMKECLEFAEELRNMGKSGWSKEKHSHYKKDISHLKSIDPYRIADLYDLHPCAEHIMKKSLCAGGRGHKDLLRDIQDIIDTAERWKEMIEEDNHEV